MINETVRLIDGALRDGTIGLAVQLAALTLESGDTVTAPTIYNEMEHGEAARDAFPDGTTCILIASGRYEQTRPRQRPRQMQTVPILLRGIDRNADTALMLRRVSYTLDALDKVLAALIVSTNTALRIRNGWSLVDINGMSGGITSAALTDTPATWELAIQCEMNPPTS